MHVESAPLMGDTTGIVVWAHVNIYIYINTFFKNTPFYGSTARRFFVQKFSPRVFIKAKMFDRFDQEKAKRLNKVLNHICTKNRFLISG